MVVNDKILPIKYIISYIRSPLLVANHPHPKVAKKRRKNIHRRQLASIIETQFDTASSFWFLSTALHSVSQSIIRARTDNIALLNRSEEACCAKSGASEEMFPDYSTFRTYHCLHNHYATLGDTTRLPIEGIGTAIYTLNGKTILTRNSLHIPALHDLL